MSNFKSTIKPFASIIAAATLAGCDPDAPSEKVFGQLPKEATGSIVSKYGFEEMLNVSRVINAPNHPSNEENVFIRFLVKNFPQTSPTDIAKEGDEAAKKCVDILGILTGKPELIQAESYVRGYGDGVRLCVQVKVPKETYQQLENTMKGLNK